MASPSSDQFEVDDELFANPEELDAMEASALQCTQLPSVPLAPPTKRITQPYHHTIARPSQNFSGRKEPAPLNTEPRAGNSGFGWEFGGKRQVEGNLERHIAAISTRAAYWSHGHGGEEEEYPDVVIGMDGRYGLGDEAEGEVVDNHARTGVMMPRASQMAETKGAAARREAIAAAANARPPLSRSNSTSSSTTAQARQPQAGPSNLQPQAQQPRLADRAFSRSVSVGSNPIRPPSRINPNPNPLPPIASQSSQSSQGSAARRVAVELEEERRKRSAVEAQVQALRDQLVQEQGRGEAREVVDKKVDDPERRMKELQAELWRAKGEAETMRRAQKDEHARLAQEADKLRAKIGDMELELQERKKDSARAVESVKTQAIFNNHAVQNSVARVRASSQRPVQASQGRPAPTPVRNGSPRGKSIFGDDEKVLSRSTKGKGKAPAPPPPPKFGHLNNAFTTPITVSRVKRARTEAISPTNGRSPVTSPTKLRDRESTVQRSSPIPDAEEEVEEIMDMQWFPGLEADEPMLKEIEEPDHKAELLYHLFNHIPFSPFQYKLDPVLVAQPTIYRVLNYKPAPTLDSTGSYAKACGDLLRACGDAALACDGLLEVLARTGTTLLGILVPSLAIVETVTPAEVAALINVLTFLSSSTWLFPPLIAAATTLQLNIGTSLKDISNRVFADQASLDNLKEKFHGDWPRELAECMADLAEGMCWFGDGAILWKGDELADVILGLSATHLDIRTVRRGLEVAWSAACYKSNFRAVLAQSEQWPGDQPVLERLSRYLIAPHTGADDQEYLRQTTTIIRAMSMLSVAAPDAVILISERSLFVPALILVLQRESTKVWGVHAELVDPIPALTIVHPALSLLHHLIYPIPFPRSPSLLSQSNPIDVSGPDPEPEPIDGLNLAQRLQVASTHKEFNDLAHIFVSCLGVLAYASPDMGDEVEKECGRWGGGDVTGIQYLAQDLLESVVEGPEGDAIFEIYEEVEEPTRAGPSGGARDVGRDGRGGEEGEEGDEEMYEAMAMEIGDEIKE